jgi:hypothetical protein
MSMERLKRSFTMDTIKEKQDGTQSISFTNFGTAAALFRIEVK